MKDETAVAIAAMLCIAMVLVIALYKDVNGTLLATGLAAIAGIAGYKIKAAREKTSESKQ